MQSPAISESCQKSSKISCSARRMESDIANDLQHGGVSALTTNSAGQHVPLQELEIRLIRLKPRAPSDGEMICCETIVVSLDEAPEYAALSYTWGGPTTNYTIKINGRSVSVRKNLWRFFREFDSSAADMWRSRIWIDAICIDQTNANGVMQQVSMMGRIYSQASKVLVWLGPAHSDSDDAMQAVVNFATHQRYPKTRAKFWNSRDGLAVARLCQRAYWTRLWIFQELMLAKSVTILCGGECVDWTDFCNVMAADFRTPEKYSARNRDYQAVLRSPAMSIVKQSLQPLDHRLWELMIANQDLRCTELKDRVFGLLGLAKMEAGSFTSPEYRASLCRLLNAVLRLHHMESSPASVEVVANDCNQLAELFGLEYARIFDLEDEHGVIVAPASIKKVQECPLGSSSERGITMWWAVFYGHQEVERLLLQNDVRKRDYEKSTTDRAWHWAVARGEVDVVRVLLQSDRTSKKSGFLGLAVWHGREDVVEFLVSAGFDVNEVGEVYDPALQIASERGSPEMIQLLLDKGADVNTQTLRGVDTSRWRPWNASSGTALQAACAAGRQEVAWLLIAEGANVNAQAGSLGSALCAASYHGHTELVQMLLDEGADPNLSHGCNGSALELAVGYEKVLQLLIEAGANVDAQSDCHSNALQRASARGDITAIQMLLQAGADINVQGGEYQNALWAALVETKDSAALALFQEGAYLTHHLEYYQKALVSASREGCSESVRLLLENGADMNTDEARWAEALERASGAGEQEIVRLLLGHRVVDVRAPPRHGRSTVFEYACKLASLHGHKKIVELLLAAGASGEDALEVASSGGFDEIVMLLLEHGADVNAPPRNGDGTALQAASFGGFEVVVALLLAAGADVNGKGAHIGGGRTAIQCAEFGRYHEVVILLANAGADLTGLDPASLGVLQQREAASVE
ncbi:hypothetical protein LTR12_001268 [Friedmanniomyces endolithicus]|nr:hypothetical protein LTR12_001268 [Friedmanniomyces endolithicus]